MSEQMPWDEFVPDAPEPAPEPVLSPGAPVQEPMPTPNLPARQDVIDFSKILKDAFAEALQEAGTKLKETGTGYVRDTWEGIREGETVDVLHPTITGETHTGKELIIADAKSRSWRTLIQGLIFDVFAGIVAAVAFLSGADPFVKETWIAFGVLLLKSVVSAVISYFMRLKVTPTIKTPGEKMAIMPVPRPMVESEKS